MSKKKLIELLTKKANEISSLAGWYSMSGKDPKLSKQYALIADGYWAEISFLINLK